MYTLEDFAEGRTYRDLYKDVYGYRPRGLTWDSEESFLYDLSRLEEEAEELGIDAVEEEDLDSWDEPEFISGKTSWREELGYDPTNDYEEDEWN